MADTQSKTISGVTSQVIRNWLLVRDIPFESGEAKSLDDRVLIVPSAYKAQLERAFAPDEQTIRGGSVYNTMSNGQIQSTTIEYTRPYVD